MKLKKLIALTCTFVMAASLLTGCGSSKKSSEVLNVYNVGDYIDMDLIQNLRKKLEYKLCTKLTILTKLCIKN